MNSTFAPMAKTWDREAFDKMLAVAKENGYRKQDIAEMLGVPPPTLSDWIAGKHAPHTVFQRMFETIEKKVSKPRKVKK